MNDDNPFATTPGFDALVLAAQERARQTRSAPSAPLDPTASARAEAVRRFSNLSYSDREAALERLRARRGS